MTNDRTYPQRRARYERANAQRGLIKIQLLISENDKDFFLNEATHSRARAAGARLTHTKKQSP